jgi:hypothetical protein
MPSERRASVRWLAPPALDLPEQTPPADLLEKHLGLGIRGFFSEAECRAWVAGVYAGRAVWIGDFGGEQFSLGRAFYTHLEQGLTRAYFDDAAGSDARVEQFLPGMQRRMLELLSRITAGHASRRRGFCGPGVHIFPAGEHVARAGGVVHFDIEGLSEDHLERRRPALTLVAMLQPPEGGGGLRLWDVLCEGSEEVEDDVRAGPSVLARYGVGDVIAIDSYRLHQIQPFKGARDRISVTVHAAEIDRGRWEAWF